MISTKKKEELKLKTQTDVSHVIWACPHRHHLSHHVNHRLKPKYIIKEIISTKKMKK